MKINACLSCIVHNFNVGNKLWALLERFVTTPRSRKTSSYPKMINVSGPIKSMSLESLSTWASAEIFAGGGQNIFDKISVKQRFYSISLTLFKILHLQTDATVAHCTKKKTMTPFCQAMQHNKHRLSNCSMLQLYAIWYKELDCECQFKSFSVSGAPRV